MCGEKWALGSESSKNNLLIRKQVTWVMRFSRFLNSRVVFGVPIRFFLPKPATDFARVAFRTSLGKENLVPAQEKVLLCWYGVDT